MGARERQRYEVYECADPEHDLQPDESHDAMDAALRGRGEQLAQRRAEARVGPEGVDGDEGRGGEDAVVELDERRVLERVAPPEVGIVGRVGVKGGEELGFGWCEAEAHVWEFIVDEAGVEAGDETAGHCCCED